MPEKAWAAAKQRVRAAAGRLVENVVRSTEKAVMLRVACVCVHTHTSVGRTVWLPKSQIIDGRASEWIVKTKLRELREELGCSIEVHGLVSSVQYA